ncbi:MAG: uracil-DNA glycosylase [Adhaeribacter sp.]
MNVKIEESWRQVLQAEFEMPYFQQLTQFVREEYAHHQVYPPAPLIFNAFNHTPFDQVKVVLIGQDPYHGAGQAHGLAFSVQEGVKPPPSLRNIFKEIKADIGHDIPTSGSLVRWADQGVFLLNATLTVRAGSPGSHQNKGWELFTDAVIRELSAQKQGLVFLLWGAYAQKKGAIIDAGKHHVLKAAHPSPFAADKGFFGCRHFSKTNDYLRKQGQQEIAW